jgi:hypothetical protein
VRAEAPRDQEDRGEHLGGEVSSRLAIAGLSEQKPDDRREVTPVERRKCHSIAGHDRRQQLFVGSLEVGWHLIN